MMKSILVIAITLLMVYVVYRTYRFAMIDNGLDTKIAKGAVILDVRTVEEYKTGHIDGSINISLGTIRDRYTERKSGKLVKRTGLQKCLQWRCMG
jgi:phage shock protein E